MGAQDLYSYSNQIFKYSLFFIPHLNLIAQSTLLWINELLEKDKYM